MILKIYQYTSLSPLNSAILMLGTKMGEVMKKILILVLMLILFSGIAMASEWVCDQNLPNETSVCGGEDSGTIWWDVAPNYVQFNYTKSQFATNESLWEVEYGYNVNSSKPYRLNLTIPEICWDAMLTEISFRMSSSFVYCFWGNGTCDTVSSNVGCWNGTNYITMGQPTSYWIGYCRSFYGYSPIFATYVYDKKWYDDDSTSGAYHMQTSPTIYWMWFVGMDTDCVKYSVIWEQMMHWEMVCTPNWYCCDFGDCIDGNKSCQQVCDYNECYNISGIGSDLFNGTLSDYDEGCEVRGYVPQYGTSDFTGITTDIIGTALKESLGVVGIVVSLFVFFSFLLVLKKSRIL